MRLLLIANPVAGDNAPNQLEHARRALERLGHEVELYLTAAAGDAERRAAKARTQDFDRVIAAGGDGTLNEAVNGLAGSSLPLGFVPLGTTNVFALETGIPFALEEAVRVACEAAPRPVTLGKANERYFLLMAGVGFDGQVVGRVSPRLKRLFGKSAYVLAALHQLVNQPPGLFTVDLKGAPLQVAGLLAANARCYGGRFTLTPAADLASPSLQLFLLLHPGRLALLRQALSLLSGRPLPARLARCEAHHGVRIVTPGIHVQLDGDYFCETPLTITSEPRALQLVYPETGPTSAEES